MIIIKNDIVKYLQLKSQGYKVLWVGEGLICMQK